MTLQNKLFLVLFSPKQENKWDSWKRFASKNNYIFSILNDPLERPVVRGQINNKPISIEVAYYGKLEKQMQLIIKSPIHNPKDNYLLVQDKIIYQSKLGIFNKTIRGICANKELEERFLIKANSERFPSEILNNENLVRDIVTQSRLSIEIIGYELILTSYSILEINKEFIDLLKLFYSFLTSFEEVSLAAANIRK